MDHDGGGIAVGEKDLGRGRLVGKYIDDRLQICTTASADREIVVWECALRRDPVEAVENLVSVLRREECTSATID